MSPTTLRARAIHTSHLLRTVDLIRLMSSLLPTGRTTKSSAPLSRHRVAISGLAESMIMGMRSFLVVLDLMPSHT